MGNYVPIGTEEAIVLREQCHNSLYFFLRGVLKQTYLYPELHLPICDKIQECALAGQPLLLVMPRGALKSTIVSYGLPLWLAIRYGSNVRILATTNTIDNAAKFGRKLRETIEKNKLLQHLFPMFVPDKNYKWTDTSFCLTRTGQYQESTFEFASIGTSVTSRHYNIIISDDILAPKKDVMTGTEIMPSIEDVEKCIGWHKLLDSLLIHDPDILDLVMDAGTRWCKYDYIQYLKDNETRYEQIDIPAINTKGEAVYPTRLSLGYLEDVRKRQGEYIFASQYLNHPYDETRMLFSMKHVHYWDTLPASLQLVLVFDPAWSKAKDACNSVPLVLGYDGTCFYVVDYIAAKMTPNESCDALATLVMRYPNIKVVSIEVVAGQKAFVDLFQNKLREMGLYKRIVEFLPHGDKDERLIATIEPIFNRDNLLLKRGMDALKQELLDFPYGRLKDIIDALSQGIITVHKFLRLSTPISPIVVTQGGFGIEKLLESYQLKHSFFSWQDGQIGGRYAYSSN